MGAERLLEEKRGAIAELCRKYAAERLRVFGSALRDDWDPSSSDIDFIVEFGRSAPMNAFDQLLGFKLDLEVLVGHSGDIVDWRAARYPYFKRTAEAHAKVVYAA